MTPWADSSRSAHRAGRIPWASCGSSGSTAYRLSRSARTAIDWSATACLARRPISTMLARLPCGGWRNVQFPLLDSAPSELVTGYVSRKSDATGSFQTPLANSAGQPGGLQRTASCIQSQAGQSDCLRTAHCTCCPSSSVQAAKSRMSAATSSADWLASSASWRREAAFSRQRNAVPKLVGFRPRSRPALDRRASNGSSDVANPLGEGPGS